MVKAFDFAFEKVGYQVAGKKIQIIIGDSQGDAAKAIDVARKMVENDHVDMIVGPTQGGEEMAVAGYINQVGIPEIFTNPEPLGVIAQKMKWCVGSGGTEPQISSAAAVYSYEQAGYKKVDILAPDIAPGHGFLNAYMAAFKKKGGQIVSETYTPYPTQDFAPYLTVLKDADALAGWMDGEQSIKFLNQYHEMGIGKRLPLIAAFHGSFLAPFILKALTPAAGEAMVGRLTPTPYSPLLDTPFNKQWTADFKAKFGNLPEDTDSGPYQGAMVIMEALKATNGDTNPEKLRQALIAVNFQGPEGPVKFDQQTGASIKTIYIAKVVKQGNDFTWQPVFSYPDVSPMGF
jgi:branched-chain amino acid transport system substrate-binding protein